MDSIIQEGIESFPFTPCDNSSVDEDIFLSLANDPTFSQILRYDSNLLYQESPSPLASPILLTVAEEGSTVQEPFSTSDQSSPELSPLQFCSDNAIPSTPTTVTEEPSKKKTRKRQRKTDPCEGSDTSCVTLSRDQLLNFTSHDLEEFARNLAKQRKLTPSEEKELKRQRRLIKNRESASASRERKRNYVEELEMQINSLKSDNSKMSQELAHIKSENKTLKEEIKNLQLLFSKKTEVNELDSKISFGELLNSKKVETPLVNRVKAAGVTLLILLFSFGLFFNNLAPLRTNLPAPLSKVLAEREEIPMVFQASLAPLHTRKLAEHPIPQSQFEETSLSSRGTTGTTGTATSTGTTGSTSSTSASTGSSTSASTGSSTRTVGDESTHVHKIETVATEKEGAFMDLVASKRRDSSPPLNANFQPKSGDSSVGNSSFNGFSQETRKRKLEAIARGEEDMNSLFLSEFANESSSTNNPQGESSELVQWFNKNIQPNVKPNTAYIACSDAQQITPVNAPPFDPNGPFYVSFLIPTVHANASKAGQLENVVMEVTCNVVDISVSPLSEKSERLPIVVQ